ncbi:hypothetical protein CQA66_08855 [Helicobacter aurati]|uniref:Uncharacterized protein n=1 Tax=Helicobacter aurati TaxID=137778 RepID=A0A3D8IXH7_9HELI|nr:hypothetical protein [Helicobacter aurati]RDU69763.1 hypothetical protein CQA66_08855 [Helicobacter aurati]
MCVLCGEMMSSFHWSDTKRDETTSIVSGEEQKQRMRSRLKRVKILNHILEFYGLKLKEWQGSKYILSNKKGRDVIVNDLGDLWQKVEELEKIMPDALNPSLLRFLEAKNG